MQPFECFCGMKTREPFLVNGQLMCVMCAENIAPRLVNSRTSKNWKEFTQSNHKAPSRPSYRARWNDEDDD